MGADLHRAASRPERQTGDRPFQYQNAGKRRCTSSLFHASCGCTTAQSQKEEVPPGDKGEITATFNIGDRTGTQIKTVTVETDEAINQKTVLTLKAEIPQQLEITPNFVFWKQGEKADTKTINVKVGKDFTVKHIKVTSSTRIFKPKWRSWQRPIQNRRETTGHEQSGRFDG